MSYLGNDLLFMYDDAIAKLAEARGNVAGVPPVEFTEQEGIALL